MVNGYVIPAVEAQLHHSKSTLDALTVESAKKKFGSRMETFNTLLGEILEGLDNLEEALHHLEETHDEGKKMEILSHKLLPCAEKLRTSCDASEKLVADEFWLIPKYRELLFSNH
jgi:glutamine synthetase type III